MAMITLKDINTLLGLGAGWVDEFQLTNDHGANMSQGSCTDTRTHSSPLFVEPGTVSTTNTQKVHQNSIYHLGAHGLLTQANLNLIC